MLLDIYKNNQTFVEGYDYFCIRNCIRQILEFYKIPNAEYYIDTTIGVEMNIPTDNIEDIMINYDIETSTVLYPYTNKIKSFMPVDDDLSDIWSSSKKKLDEGIPIISYVDIYHLKHTSYYNIMHAIHAIIVCGYLENDQGYYIIDYTKPWFYKGEISREDYEKARLYHIDEDIYGSTRFPPRKKWLYVDQKDWNSDPIDLFKISLLELERKYFSPEKIRESNMYLGIDVIKKLLDIIKQLRDAPFDTTHNFFKKLCNQMFLMGRYGQFFVQYIEQFLSQYNTLKIHDKIQIFIDSNVLWRKLLTLIMKITIAPSDTVYSKIINIYHEIIENDEKRYEALMSIQKQLH